MVKVFFFVYELAIICIIFATLVKSEDILCYVLYDMCSLKMKISIFFLFIIPHIYQMFWYAYSFNSDISKWDTSSVINMEYMFGRAQRFNRDLSTWDVSNVRTMQTMFYYAMRFNSDIGQWDVSNVENMYGMVSVGWWVELFCFELNVCEDIESGRVKGVWEFAHISLLSFVFYYPPTKNLTPFNPPYLLTRTNSLLVQKGSTKIYHHGILNQ